MDVSICRLLGHNWKDLKFIPAAEQLGIGQGVTLEGTVGQLRA